MTQPDIDSLGVSDSGYPDELKLIPDPPQTLYVRGVLTPSAPRVAIVGTRTATSYGLAVASELARDLASAGVEVVSGLALGIDAAAHRGALEGGGSTIAVLPSAIDNPVPKTNYALAESITRSGALVSEIPAGNETHRGNFIIRNRIISGLSQVTVVVEGAITSGALITARAALEQGRIVMAVPGSIYSLMSAGPHQLLQDGAAPVTKVQDILTQLSLDVSKYKSTKTGSESGSMLAAYLGEPRSVDELTRLTKHSAGTVAAELAMLELNGDIVEVEAGRFMTRN